MTIDIKIKVTFLASGIFTFMVFSQEFEVFNAKENSCAFISSETIGKEYRRTPTDSTWNFLVNKYYREEQSHNQNKKIYYHKKTPSYKNISWVYAYISVIDSKRYLRFTIQNYNQESFYFEKLKFGIDNEIVDFPLEFGFDSFEHNEKIIQWADVDVDSEIKFKILDKISNSEITKAIYIRNQNREERVLTDDEKIGIKRILQLYRSR